MACRRRLSAPELPEEIIQHIQYFMKPKLSAQSSVLSKSWYKAWSTRPNLDLINPDDFYRRKSFWNFVTKTVQRYIHLNLKVDKFRLSFCMGEYDSSPVYMLIVDALKLRMNVLHLDFWQGSPYDLSLYDLPAQVFANKYLTELHLTGCEIDYVNVLCSTLRSLELINVCIDDYTFQKILLGCPVIEYLKLCIFFDGDLPRINASKLLNLKTLIVAGSELGESDFASADIGRFLNLIQLKLNNVSIDDSFFKSISSSFPKLKDLTVENVYNNPTFKISSRSITSLTLNNFEIIEMAELDVPNIRYFKFSGKRIPPLSFTTSSKEWKSKISLNYSSSGTLDLSKLREFLRKSGQSKITLRLSIDSASRNVAPERNVENFHLPAMEELIEQRNQNDHSTTTQNSELEEVNVELFEESLKQWQPVKTFLDDPKFPKRGAYTPCFELKWGSVTPAYTIIKLIYLLC